MALEETGILYLERNAFYFCDGVKIAKLDFLPEVIRDLDIVNEEVLIKSIFDFIDKQKFNVGKFLFVLSESAIFVVGTDERNVNLIPYNNVLSKKYATQSGEVIIATNKDLVDVISEAFQEKGFGRDEVVPSMLFGQLTGRQFDLNLANFMIKNQETATGKSMLDPIPVMPTKTSDMFKVTTGKSTMLPMLLGIFGLMLVGLVLLLIFRK